MKLEVRGLKDGTDCSGFCCGNKLLDDFFHNNVFMCCNHHFCSGYQVINRETNEIVALFDLSFDSLKLEHDDMDDVLLERFDNLTDMPDYFKNIFSKKEIFPALCISHLAVDRKYQSKGIGKFVVDSVCVLAKDQELAGCQFVTVDAVIKQAVVKFYHSNGFYDAELPDPNRQTRRMYRLII